MRNSIVWSIVAALFLWGGSSAAAQTTVGIGAHAGASFPTGDVYGETVDMGFLGGIDLWFPLSGVTPGLSWYTSADAIAHGISEDEVDSGFLFVPLMTGLRLDVPVGPVSAFATGQAGLLLTKGPDAEILGIEAADSEWGTSLGYNVGGGLQLTDQIYAGVRYWPLGDRTFEYEGDLESQREVSFLDVYVGFGVR